jgi:phosphate transport system protein
MHFENELADLKHKLLSMGSHAESAIRFGVDALMQRNYELAIRVKADDEVLDRLEVEIDETAIRLLAKAPLASDLRLITVVMKVSQNLERAGDEASKIAKRARDLSQSPPVKVTVPIPQLANVVLLALKRALDAFVQQDPTAARALIPEDRQIDNLNKDIHRQLVDHMMENREDIPASLHLMVVAKSLERIADHAKNIAEEVVYLCEAQDIRHTPLTKVASA